MGNGPILITGFEAFETGSGRIIDPNPTAALATSLADAPNRVSAVLPVAFARTKPALSALLQDLRPSIWLGLGAAVSRDQIDLEGIAINIQYARRTDNDGNRPDGAAIIEGAPLALRSGLDVVACASALTDRGLPVRVSWSAGTFLCNQALYVGCHHYLQQDAPGIAAFAHVPVEGIDPAMVRDSLDEVLAWMA